MKLHKALIGIVMGVALGVTSIVAPLPQEEM